MWDNVPTMMKDPYQILGLTRGASQSDVRTAYRRLARRYHPDLNPGDANASAKFQVLSQAYEHIQKARSKPSPRKAAKIGATLKSEIRYARRKQPQRAAPIGPIERMMSDIFKDIDDLVQRVLPNGLT